MRALNVDLAVRPAASKLLVGAVCGFLGMTVAAFGVALFYSSEAERQLQEIHQAKLQREQQTEQEAFERSTGRVHEQPPYAEHALTALKQQRFPLDQVLTALEAVSVPNVRVISVDIVTLEGSVRVQVEFSDYAALIQYLQDLNAGEPTERWALSTAQTGPAGTTGRSTASLTAAWSAR